MRRVLLFLILCTIWLGLAAQQQTHVMMEQAKEVGYTFMRGEQSAYPMRSNLSREMLQLVYTGHVADSITRSATDCFYVFALQPKGFVIVAADERVEPVLGYSYDNDFAVEDMPEHVRGWLGNYEQQIKAAIDQNLAPDSEITAKWTRLEAGQPLSNTRSGESVGPLLTTTWDQGQYYNALCPEDANGPGGHAVTGCVATAMAQIINYHQYPQHGRGTHTSYTTNIMTVDYDNANYDYTLMPNVLTATSTSVEVNAVATLMRDCGVAVNMAYAADESGALDQEARAALINYFKYSPDLSFAEKSFFTDEEWETLLRNDLDAGNPVYYSGNGTGGHAFICDGYDDNGYFSFNFGWGGYCNGWYLTSSVNPGTNNFSDSQSAILGIVPDSTGNVIIAQTYGTSTFTVDRPLEFYHLMGHNAYEGNNYSNSCYNIIKFISANDTSQLVVDIVDFEDQQLSIYDGDVSQGNRLRSLSGWGENDLTPIVSSSNAMDIAYSGNMYHTGFYLTISPTDGCRRVSNITPFIEDITTVHLTWNENGNATQWKIEYGVKDFALGTGTTHIATTNTATFSNLQPFTEYDFYIWPICDSDQYSTWNKLSLFIEGAYWQDVVTSQPAGYVYDTLTNSAQISSAEGLAWWTKRGYSIDGHLTADIDLSGYKWRSMELNSRNFYGHGHVITNMYVNEDTGPLGLFSYSYGIIDDVGLLNADVTCANIGGGCVGWDIGGLCGRSYGTIRNCYVANSRIFGLKDVGGLVGTSCGTVCNCFVNASVTGYQWTGLLIGDLPRGTVRNCYAAGSVKILSWCYIAGIVAYADGDEISNCYSVETEMGVVGNQGTTFIVDTSTFVKTDDGCILFTPVIIDENTETDLLSALNREVDVLNDSVYCTWMADTGNINGGYPVLGNKYHVECPNVSEVSVQNVTTDNDYAVSIGWTENGDASQWRIRYRRHDRPDTTYTYITTTNNPDTLLGIPLGYEYDFSVRAICDTDHRSGWSKNQTALIDLPLWTDVVTSQPAGYVEDSVGNVEIYSAEGLAWLAVLTNGFHNQQMNTFEGKTVSLKSDINIGGYRWFPISDCDNNYDWWDGFSGTFDGENHKISNVYMYGVSGLFGMVYMGRVKNVHLDGGLSMKGSAGLIGKAMDCYEISNCHTSVTVYSSNLYGVYTGSLCGEIDHFSSDLSKTIKTTMSNCSSSGTVYGLNYCGSLIGTLDGYWGPLEVRNCYATGDVNIFNAGEYDNADARGGLIGYIRGDDTYVNNCYSTGHVEIHNSSCYGKVVGCLDWNSHAHYIYGQDNVNMGWNLTGNDNENVSNTAQFHHDGNTNALLNTVSIDETNYSDMLDALNAWVISKNDPTLKQWTLDTLTGYPVFSDYFVPSCYNPDSLTVSQATVVGDATIKTRLAWKQEGEPDHWEVLYVPFRQSINSATIVSVYSNPCVMAGLPVGQPLDFYVRAVCDESNASGWYGPVTYIPDKLHWTEVVTSQPNGFQVDNNRNVYISSAEELAWLSSIANELNGAQLRRFNQIVLTQDIDLSDYRWTPIGRWSTEDWFEFTSFNGNNHIISGLYCNDLSEDQGLFGVARGSIHNLILSQCNVYGTDYVGAIIGWSLYNSIYNCMVSGNVKIWGNSLAGSCAFNGIENSCFVGTISISGGVGGICGVPVSSTFSNCYAVSSLADNITKEYYNATNSDFTGSGNTWTLSTPPFIGGSFHTDLVDALNAWVEENNTDGRYLRWVADSNMVNGGYPIFERVSYPMVEAQDTVVAQGYYCWHGMVFTSDTLLTDTLYTENGYDSIVTYHIFVTPAPLTEITVEACGNYTWNHETYLATGNYVQTFTATNNADSVVILHLTINRLTGVDEQVVCGNSYTWIDGVTYVASNNTATHTLLTADGCDSVVTLNLTINPIYDTAPIEITICENDLPYRYVNGIIDTTFGVGTISQTIPFTLSTIHGCDSTITLNLTVLNATFDESSDTACGSYNWFGANLTASGDYTRVLTNAVGCDSIITLHLTINQASEYETTVTSCGSFEWYGNNLTHSGNYTHTIENGNVHGCDSTITLHLIIVTINTEINGTNAEVDILEPQDNAVYQWMNCETNELLDNETGEYCCENYTEGDFACIITIGECSDTTECWHLWTQGIPENGTADITLYPNPTTGTVTVQMDPVTSALNPEIQVFDIYGRMLDVFVGANNHLPQQTMEIDLSQYANGIYLLKVTDRAGHILAVRKVVKE